LAPTLYHAGLIWHNYEQIVYNTDKPELRIWCIFTDRNAFENWRSNSFVKKHCSDILSSAIDIAVTVTPMEKHENVCRCINSAGLILRGHGFGNKKASVYCGDCSGYYPGYRVKELFGDLSTQAEVWSLISGHVYDIWMLTGELEEWAVNELSEPSSDLNKSGLQYASQLGKLIKKTVWYYLFTPDEDTTENCPICKSVCNKSKWDGPKFLCKRCKIVY